MSWLDIFRRNPPPRSSEPAPRGRRNYDAAATGPRTDGWWTPSTSALSETSGGLVATRNRARDLVRNSAWAKRIVDALTSNLVGTGIRPMLATGSPDLDKRALAAWEAWAPNACPSSHLGIYGLQALAARAVHEGGEVFARRRPRYPSDMPGIVPLQIQLMEGDQLDHSLTEVSPQRRIVQGVEFDPLDRRVAYHFLTAHPGDAWTLGTAWNTVRVDASQVAHCYHETRPGQVRGITTLHAVIHAIWDLAGYTDSERVGSKARATIVGTVTGGEPDGMDGIGPSLDPDEENPQVGPTPVMDLDGNPVEQLVPGAVIYAPDGKRIELNHPGTAGGFADYVAANLREIAAGVGLSYASLSGDMGEANFAQAKLGQQQEYRLARQFREHVFSPMFLDPIWVWFCDAAILAGILPSDKRLYRVRWSSPQIESVDPLTDAKAAQHQRRAGTHSLREIVAARGRAIDDVLDEIQADHEACVARGLVLDSDPSQTATSGSVQSQSETSAGGGNDQAAA